MGEWRHGPGFDTPGAVVGIVLWIVITRLFAIVLDHFADYGSVHGALGSAVILLTWLWQTSARSDATVAIERWRSQRE